jgi:Tfp pilus assembly protein PilF
LAIAYFHNEDYKKALAPLNTVIVRDPKSTAAHHMLGKTHFMLGEFVESTSELNSPFAGTQRS